MPLRDGRLRKNFTIKQSYMFGLKMNRKKKEGRDRWRVEKIAAGEGLWK